MLHDLGILRTPEDKWWLALVEIESDLQGGEGVGGSARPTGGDISLHLLWGRGNSSADLSDLLDLDLAWPSSVVTRLHWL